MGILDDTLRDAAQPLPSLTLRRAMHDATPQPEPAPDFDAPAEAGDALTIYRLQKPGGTTPPLAPPAPRAVDAGAARPLHAPVEGIFNDATHQFVISKEGLETGKGQVRTRNLDATDRQQELISSDPSFRLHYDESTVSSATSRRDPSPFDDLGKLVHRNGSTDGMRRATGRGAASGDPSPGEPAAPVAPELQNAPPDPNPTGPTNARPLHAPPPPADSRAAIGETPGIESPGASPRRMPAVDTPPGEPAGILDAATTSAAVAHAIPAAPAIPRAPTMQGLAAATPPAAPPPAGPRLSIGRIEVTVLAQAAAPASPAPPKNDAFLSKHYLRRL